MIPRHLLALAAGLALARSLAAQCPDGTPPPCEGASPREVPAGSLAVLDFLNESGDTTDAYLAEGVTDEVTARLSQVHRLRVTSRTAIRRLPNSARLTPQTLGRTLDVAYLVSGGVRRGPGRVRITIELLRAATGVTVWSNVYDRPDGDLLDIEADLAASVARAVAGRLLPAEQASLATPPTQDPSAYDHFLRGNFLLLARTPSATVRAIDEYEAATARDPTFVRARARIAYAYGLFLDWGWPYPGVSRQSLIARGLRETDLVLQRDSTLSDAWMARAYLLRMDDPRTFRGADDAFERAIALDPSNAEALQQYAWTLQVSGRDSAAREAYGRALAVDPLRAITLDELSILYFARRRFREALAWEDRAQVTDPDAFYVHADRAHTRLLLGDLAGADQDAAAARRLVPPGYTFWGDAISAMVAARRGDTTSARAVARRLLRELGDRPQPTAQQVRWIAGALAAAGDEVGALALVETTPPQERGLYLWYWLQFPEFDMLRADPRFRRVVDELAPPGALEP